MSITFSYEFYEVFEDKFGKESAKKVVDSLENAISIAIDYKWAKTKDELLEAIRKEFVTKELFEEKIETLRVEFRGDIERLKIELEGKMEKQKTELEGKIELVKMEVQGVNMKLNFLIILMILALTLMNPVMAEIIKHFFGL